VNIFGVLKQPGNFRAHLPERAKGGLVRGRNPRLARRTRRRANALCTPWGWCDIDLGDPRNFRPAPNVLWMTSPGRFQGLWSWNRPEAVEDAQAYSRALAYRFGGDRNGWSVTKMLRIPGSINHKPDYRQPVVRLVEANWTPQRRRPRLINDEFSTAADVRHAGMRGPQSVLDTQRVDPDRHDYADVVKRYRRRVHPRVRVLMTSQRVHESNRSKCIFEIVAGLHEAGPTPNETASVLWHNPYFTDKHGRDHRKLDAEIYRILSKLGE
jgi:hypothetical protein